MNNEITQSATGLVIPKGVSEEQFFDYGGKLAQADRTLQWYIGDWYNAIPWGDKKAACEKVGLNYKTAHNYGLVCQKYESALRSALCTFKHHQVIAALPEPERLPLLEKAVENHWSTSVLKKMAFPHQDDGQQEQEKDMKKDFNWERIGIEEGIIVAGSGGSRNIAKKEIDDLDNGAIKSKDEDRLRSVCRKVFAMRNPDKAKDDAQKAKDDLPKSAQQKLDAAIKKWQAVLFADMQKQFNEQLAAAKAEIQLERDAVWALKREAEAERDAAVEYRKGIDSHMTQDEFRLIRSCLHADRVPDELKERFDKAFVIFNRLEKTVNTKQPIASLREKGWEKVSPFYKSH